jgi:Tol biopolymer transport system component
MSSYQRVKAALLTPPINASLSPDGSKIALTERIKLYTVTTDGAHTDIWFEDNEEQGPTGGVVWSPDGKYIAFVVDFKNQKCPPCRMVALLRISDGLITYLEDPAGLETDAPRWTQDGRLLVNVHAGEPADGVAYVYDISGHGIPAEGVYILSSSHEGQKWYPWRPGRIWRAGMSERADSYNSD